MSMMYDGQATRPESAADGCLKWPVTFALLLFVFGLPLGLIIWIVSLFVK